MIDQTPVSDDWQDFYKNPPPPPPPPPVKSVTGKRIALFAAIVLGLVLGQWVVRWALTPTNPTTDTAADQRPARVAPLAPELIEKLLSPTPTAPAPRITVTSPDKLGGRSKNTEADLTKMASDTGTRLNGLPQATAVVSQFYGSHSKKNLTTVIAAAAKVAQSDLDIFVNNALIGSEVVKQPATYDAGPLGGKAMCGQGSAKGIQFAICGWADEGSVGVIIWYYTSVEKAQAEFHAVRASIEQVG